MREPLRQLAHQIYRKGLMEFQASSMGRSSSLTRSFLGPYPQMLSAPACASPGTLGGGGGALLHTLVGLLIMTPCFSPARRGKSRLAQPPGPFRTADFVHTCLLESSPGSRASLLPSNSQPGASSSLEWGWDPQPATLARPYAFCKLPVLA